MNKDMASGARALTAAAKPQDQELLQALRNPAVTRARGRGRGREERERGRGREEASGEREGGREGGRSCSCA